MSSRELNAVEVEALRLSLVKQGVDVGSMTVVHDSVCYSVPVNQAAKADKIVHLFLQFLQEREAGR